MTEQQYKRAYEIQSRIRELEQLKKKLSSYQVIFANYHNHYDWIQIHENESILGKNIRAILAPIGKKFKQDLFAIIDDAIDNLQSEFKNL